MIQIPIEGIQWEFPMDNFGNFHPENSFISCGKKYGFVPIIIVCLGETCDLYMDVKVIDLRLFFSNS